MFKPDKPKNAFLQKKNQEKAKVAEQAKTKLNISKLQKNLRAFLVKKTLLNHTHFESPSDIKLQLIMKHKLTALPVNTVEQFVHQLSRDSSAGRLYFQSELVLQNSMEKNCLEIAVNILNHSDNQMLRRKLLAKSEFRNILSNLFVQCKAQSFVNACTQEVKASGLLMQIDGKILLKVLLHQFRANKMEIEHEEEFNQASTLLLIETLFNLDHQMSTTVEVAELQQLTLFFINSLNSFTTNTEKILCYLFEQILNSGIRSHERITLTLMKENKNIIALIDDVEMLQEIQSKLRRHEHMQEFTNQFLVHIRSIMTHRTVLELFYSGKHSTLSQVLLKMVTELSILFQDRKLIFIREIISSDSVLMSLANSKDSMFREGLKMRLLAMDDPEFKKLDIFSMQQWHFIIKSCVEACDIKIQKIAQKVAVQVQGSLIPFKKRNKDEIEFKTAVDLLTNLHKKVLRTNKFDAGIFVDYGLSALLQHFLFGKGAMRIEIFLRQLPFLFSFQSRIAKFKQFVKTDKTHYDRTLFLQEEIDDDLIIAVRRGHEFMDAFEACMTRDLRQKYKIIFFNEQGLEEEGVDGGGLIKEFINRVLSSSFSQQYSLFMDSPLNEILPNPYSGSIAEYEFVGRVVGKAVYEGINIEQKFAEPFLNLVIGRQNTFQDIQFIDPDIYRSLLSMKNTTQDISIMQQTFVIYDSLPNGQNNYIDLLCPSKAPLAKQTPVTNENKLDFIMSYADFKCNKQIEEKTRLFRKGFTRVIKPEWLTMFSNQELNSIISGSNPDFNVDEMKESTVLTEYHEKDETILHFWQVVREMNCAQKSLLLLYITSCSRPPTLGFGALKPKLCINKDNNINHLPTANTCMNVLRLPNYKNKLQLRKKLIYAINSKAGFQFA